MKTSAFYVVAIALFLDLAQSSCVPAPGGSNSDFLNSATSTSSYAMRGTLNVNPFTPQSMTTPY